MVNREDNKVLASVIVLDVEMAEDGSFAVEFRRAGKEFRADFPNTFITYHGFVKVDKFMEWLRSDATFIEDGKSEMWYFNKAIYLVAEIEKRMVIGQKI